MQLSSAPSYTQASSPLHSRFPITASFLRFACGRWCSDGPSGPGVSLCLFPVLAYRSLHYVVIFLIRFHCCGVQAHFIQDWCLGCVRLLV